MCDDTRDCVIQFCPPDDEHMRSKHVEALNKLIKNFSASSWLILINKLFNKLKPHDCARSLSRDFFLKELEISVYIAYYNL